MQKVGKQVSAQRKVTATLSVDGLILRISTTIGRMLPISEWRNSVAT